MNRRIVAGAAGLWAVLALAAGAADAPKDKAASKTALQALNEFIGSWKGTGGPALRDAKGDIWKESMSWGWKFKGDDAWIAVEFKDGKFERGDLRYLPAKKQYQLTLLTKDKKEQVFEGVLKRKVLTLERTDPDTSDKQFITMSTNNEGLRFIYEYAVQTKGKGLQKKLFLVQHTREGESIGGGGKKQECVVTGGLGTMAVTYNGKTYYVCCSGCRDAFNENPKKFVDEYEKKKKR